MVTDSNTKHVHVRMPETLYNACKLGAETCDVSLNIWILQHLRTIVGMPTIGSESDTN